MKALFSRRGKQKCSLQLYPCLMLIDPVPHFASAPWNLRGIENVSDPPFYENTHYFLTCLKTLHAINISHHQLKELFIYLFYLLPLIIFGMK